MSAKPVLPRLEVHPLFAELSAKSNKLSGELGTLVLERESLGDFPAMTEIEIAAIRLAGSDVVDPATKERIRKRYATVVEFVCPARNLEWMLSQLEGEELVAAKKDFSAYRSAKQAEGDAARKIVRRPLKAT